MGGFLYITSGETRFPDEHDRLTREIQSLQRQLAHLGDVLPAEWGENGSRVHTSLTRVGRILKLRKARDDIFGRSLFGEPAWDMLLHLYDAHLQGRPECVTSVCAASGVPPSTALRWIHCLLDRKWILREGDSCDQRRLIVSLSPKGVLAMECFFDQPELAGSL